MIASRNRSVPNLILTILANRHFMGLFVAGAVCACSSSTTNLGHKDSEVRPLVTPPALPLDAAVGISEVQARRELDALFRDAGFRILNDEPLPNSHIEVVLDGYDPERRVGYEYIDEREAALSLGRAEQEGAASDHRLLIIDACSLDELRRVASLFLATATAPDAGP